jgi:hypothetical protein
MAGIEQEITRIEKMPENTGRRSLIKSLNNQLKALQVKATKLAI